MASRFSSLAVLADAVAQTTRHSSDYDPTADIQDFIDSQPPKIKPEVLIYISNGIGKTYTNHPELLGTVVIHNDDNKMTFVSHAVPGNTQTLRGDSAEWIGGLFETNYDFAKFLEEFIILNT